MRHESQGIYRNEVDKPEMPSMNTISPMENMGIGMHDFKGEADPIAYGQCGGSGMKEDEKRVRSQFKNYNWD